MSYLDFFNNVRIIEIQTQHFGEFMEYVIGFIIFCVVVYGILQWAAKSYVDSILNDPTGGIVPVEVFAKNNTKRKQ